MSISTGYRQSVAPFGSVVAYKTVWYIETELNKLVSVVKFDNGDDYLIQNTYPQIRLSSLGECEHYLENNKISRCT